MLIFEVRVLTGFYGISTLKMTPHDILIGFPGVDYVIMPAHHFPFNIFFLLHSSSRKPVAGPHLSPIPSSPHTPPYVHAHQTTPTSGLYSTPPPGSGGSVQSTVIVQQPGQSIYVQQQVGSHDHINATLRHYILFMCYLDISEWVSADYHLAHSVHPYPSHTHTLCAAPSEWRWVTGPPTTFPLAAAFRTFLQSWTWAAPNCTPWTITDSWTFTIATPDPWTFTGNAPAP